MSGPEASGSAEPGAVRAGDDRRRPGGQAGFTLLEALVALTVVGLAVAGALEAASRALAGQADASRRAEATALAEARLSEIAVLPRDSLPGLGASGWRSRDLAGRAYRQRSSVRPAEGSDHLWRAATEVVWTGGSVELATVFYRPPRDPAGGRLR